MATAKKKQVAVTGNKAGTFSSVNQPDFSKRGHRGKDKLTRDIKEGIVDAAIRHGLDGKGADGLSGYLFMLSRDYPKQFTSLLGRMLPLQIQGNLGQFIGAVNITPVPQGQYLTAEQIKSMQATESDIIDVEPIRIVDKEEDAA